MTKIFILIVLITSSTSSRAGSMTSVEFNSLEACERAKTRIIELTEEKWYSVKIATCVAKD